MHHDPERSDRINRFLLENECAALLAWHAMRKPAGQREIA
jgi:hypothetical protein